MAEGGSGTARERAAALLTDRERQCLRLVLTGRNSKEIAIQLGISPHTVDARLRSAIRTFGVSTRFQAARALAEAEGAASQPLISQPDAIASASHPIDPMPVEGEDAQEDVASRSAVREDQARYAPSAPQGWRPFDFRVPLSGRKPRNDLTPLARVAIAIVLLVLVIAGVGFFVIAAEGLARIFWAGR